MGKRKLYMVVDTETATLPFVEELVHGDSELKKKLAIARPLVYDIGWQIIDRKGKVYKKRQYLVAETFAVPSVFNTAYYKEKRPIYCGMIERGEITVETWDFITKKFQEDMNDIDYMCAYNAMFDYKKAICFTDLYISKLYSANYQTWENGQRQLCQQIINKRKKEKEESEFEKDIFIFRGKSYKILDIWGISCERLLNNRNYKKFCLETKMLSDSGDFFKTSAEAAWRYTSKQREFIEAHTALEDVIIESALLCKVFAQKGKSVTEGIIFFPFRELGYTSDFLRSEKTLRREHFEPVLKAMQTRLEKENVSPYAQGLETRFHSVRNHLENYDKYKMN